MCHNYSIKNLVGGAIQLVGEYEGIQFEWWNTFGWWGHTKEYSSEIYLYEKICDFLLFAVVTYNKVGFLMYIYIYIHQKKVKPYLTLSFPAPRWAGDNTHLCSDSHISKT